MAKGLSNILLLAHMLIAEAYLKNSLKMYRETYRSVFMLLKTNLCFIATPVYSIINFITQLLHLRGIFHTY